MSKIEQIRYQAELFLNVQTDPIPKDLWGVTLSMITNPSVRGRVRLPIYNHIDEPFLRIYLIKMRSMIFLGA